MGTGARKSQQRNRQSTGDDLETQREAAGAQDAQERLARWLDLPIEDQAYLLHLRGHSLRAIAARLHIDKDTAHRYVRAIEEELAPKRREEREDLLHKAVERLRAIQARAGDEFEMSGEPSLLNTMTACEREIAKLEGLYGVVTDDGLDTGITITISRRNAVSRDAGGSE